MATNTDFTTPYTGDYYRSTSAPTTALSTRPLVVSIPTPPRLRSVLAGIVAGLPIAFFSFLLGVFWQDRGWAALLVFAVVLAAVTIRGRNGLGR